MARKYHRYKQGIYRPKNHKKFGEHKCIYRSSYEYEFMRWCDDHPRITNVRYEKIVIPYLCTTDNKKKPHKYYLDVLITMQEKDGPKNYLIEIKPFKQTIPPTVTTRKKKKTILTEQYNWQKNSCKWDAARLFCKKYNLRWCILTEKGIYIDEKFYAGKMFGKK
jgi:hypothetical protein